MHVTEAYIDGISLDGLIEPLENVTMARLCKCERCRKAHTFVSWDKWKSLVGPCITPAPIKVLKPDNQLTPGAARARYSKRHEAKVRARKLEIALARTEQNSPTSHPEAGTAVGGQWARLISAVQNAQAGKQVRAVIGVLGTVQGDVGDWFALVKRLQEKEVHPVVTVYGTQEITPSPIPPSGNVGVGLRCWVLVDEGGDTSKPKWVMENRHDKPVPVGNYRAPEGLKQP